MFTSKNNQLIFSSKTPLEDHSTYLPSGEKVLTPLSYSDLV